MFIHNRFIVSVACAAVVFLTVAADPAHAQTAPSGTCTSSSYASPVNAVANALQAADYSKPNTVGSVLMSIISLRYQYEDTTPPAGCESAQPIILQYLTLQEDVIYTTLGAKVDAANKDLYNEVSATLAPARYPNILAALNNALGNATVSDSATLTATLSAATPAATPQPCTDPTFAAQVKNDMGNLGSGTAAGVTFIKFRYKYEDATAPAACTYGRALIIQTMATSEDFGALSIMGLADPTNAATYTNYINNTVDLRVASFSKSIPATFPTVAATPAATASS